MSKYVAGIDFGTSNSSVSITDGGVPEMIKLEGNSTVLPTALFFEDNNVFFGHAAEEKNKDRYSEGRFIKNIKYILGRELSKEFTMINGKRVGYLNIIEAFLSKLKFEMDFACKEEVDSVVIGRPVHFVDDNEEADSIAQNTLEALAKHIGFKNVSFQYEPIAAALKHEKNLTEEQIALVVDIGGGTSDFSIIKLSPENKTFSDRVKDILATGGIHIGGNDFDKYLSLKSFMPVIGFETKYKTHDGKKLTVGREYFDYFSNWSEIKEAYEEKNNKIYEKLLSDIKGSYEPEKLKRLKEIIENRYGHLNLAYVENTKQILSDEKQTDVVLDFLSDKPKFLVTRKEFENAIEDSVDKITKCLISCLTDSGIGKRDVDLVIFTGGSTNIPYVANTILKLVPKAKIINNDKMTSVGQGLGYEALLCYKK